MRAGKAMITVVSLLAIMLQGQQASVFAGSDDKKASRSNGLDLKDVPIEVIEAAQKEVPKLAFMNVEKQTNWRRRQSYRIWGMDTQQREIYLEVSAAGKILEKPKVIKRKEKEQETQQQQLQPIPQPLPQPR